MRWAHPQKRYKKDTKQYKTIRNNTKQYKTIQNNTKQYKKTIPKNTQLGRPSKQFEKYKIHQWSDLTHKKRYKRSKKNTNKKLYKKYSARATKQAIREIENASVKWAHTQNKYKKIQKIQNNIKEPYTKILSGGSLEAIWEKQNASAQPQKKIYKQIQKIILNQAGGQASNSGNRQIHQWS